jgi:hypothetical protein
MGRWLAVTGIVLTACYAGFTWWLVGDRIHTLQTMGLNEVGDFLAGAFGPLAILWLVLGFFQQGIELRLGTNALLIQADELKASVEQQAALVQAQNGVLRNYENSVEPFLGVKYEGSTTIAGTKKYQFEIINRGTHCESLKIRIFKAGDLISENGFASLTRDEFKRFFVPYDLFSTNETILVSTFYRRISGADGVQDFELTRSAPGERVEISKLDWGRDGC